MKKMFMVTVLLLIGFYLYSEETVKQTKEDDESFSYYLISRWSSAKIIIANRPTDVKAIFHNFSKILYSLFPADIKTFMNFDFKLFEKNIQFSTHNIWFSLSHFSSFSTIYSYARDS